MATLLEKLLDFYKNEPNDPFNIYGLALEYKKFDLEKSKFYFELLLEKFPEYVATYYHAALLFIEQNDFDKAEKTYQKGISIATELGKNHALSELKRAYQWFLDDMED